MRTFDRYLLSQLLTLFGFFSLVLVAVYWVNRAAQLFDRLITGGQNIGIFAEFTALTLPMVILNVLPISALVATIYGINRLATESELVVAQTSGLGPFALARPVFVFGVIVALVVSVIAHGLVPLARTALAERGLEVSRDVTAKFLKEGEFLHPATGVTVYVREITEAGELRGVFLEDRRAAFAQTVYTAERALLVQNEGIARLLMFEGMAQTLRAQERNLTVVTFDDFSYDLEGLATNSERAPDPRELSTARLLAASELDQARTGASKAVLLYEGHDRFADGLFAVAMPLMALSVLLLGRFSRFGLWRQIAGAVFLAVIVQLLGNIAETSALRSPRLWPVTYLPALGALLLSLCLFWLATLGPLRRRQPQEAAP